jgi:hypothetical protein
MYAVGVSFSADNCTWGLRNVWEYECKLKGWPFNQKLCISGVEQRHDWTGEYVLLQDPTDSYRWVPDSDGVEVPKDTNPCYARISVRLNDKEVATYTCTAPTGTTTRYEHVNNDEYVRLIRWKGRALESVYLGVSIPKTQAFTSVLLFY